MAPATPKWKNTFKPFKYCGFNLYNSWNVIMNIGWLWASPTGRFCTNSSWLYKLLLCWPCASLTCWHACYSQQSLSFRTQTCGSFESLPLNACHTSVHHVTFAIVNKSGGQHCEPRLIGKQTVENKKYDVYTRYRWKLCRSIRL